MALIYGRNVEKQSLKGNNEADFCKYDVNMRCPKIEIIGSIFEMILSGNLKLLSYENKATLAGSLKLKDSNRSAKSIVRLSLTSRDTSAMVINTFIAPANPATISMLGLRGSGLCRSAIYVTLS